MIREICVCVRASQCEIVVCLSYILSKKSICLMFGCYDFHSPGSFDTRLGEWASAK